MKNLTYAELIKIAPKDRPFQIEVESNPLGKGSKQILWGFISDENTLNTYGLRQSNINGTDYAYSGSWELYYTGTFTLIDPRYQKPEVLEVGTKVKIIESARDIGKYDTLGIKGERQISNIYTISEVIDNFSGVSYETYNGKLFPHYCVMPVEEEKEDDDLRCIPGFEGMIEEVEELFLKAQEIVDKYKK
jgi:hypothetical protein